MVAKWVSLQPGTRTRETTALVLVIGRWPLLGIIVVLFLYIVKQKVRQRGSKPSNLRVHSALN